MKKFRVQTSHGKLHIYQKGTGPRKLLLLHGSGSDSAMLSWREVMAQFGDEYTVYAPDLLGYGKSDDCEYIRGDEFYGIHMDSIHQLVSALGIEHFGLAGLSMGGAIAIGFALQYPEMVDYLIPVGSWGLSPKMPFHKFSYWYVNRTNMTVLQYQWCAKSKMLARWSVAYSLIGNKKFITDALVQEVMESCAGDRAGKSMQDFQRSSADREQAIPYYGERLCALSMPVAFVIGEKDPLVPLRDVQCAHAMVPGSRLHVLEGCKHWTVKEQPERFYEIVGELYDANTSDRL